MRPTYTPEIAVACLEYSMSLRRPIVHLDREHVYPALANAVRLIVHRTACETHGAVKRTRKVSAVTCRNCQRTNAYREAATQEAIEKR